MKIETLLSAYESALWYVAAQRERIAELERINSQLWDQNGKITKKFLERGRELEEYKTYHGYHIGDVEFIETMHDKDERIAELEARIEALGRTP